MMYSEKPRSSDEYLLMMQVMFQNKIQYQKRRVIVESTGNKQLPTPQWNQKKIASKMINNSLHSTLGGLHCPNFAFQRKTNN